MAFWGASLWNHDPWARFSVMYILVQAVQIIKFGFYSKHGKKVKDSRACEPKGLSDPGQLAGIREAFIPARMMSIAMKVRVGGLQTQACDRNCRVRSYDRTGTP